MASMHGSEGKHAYLDCDAALLERSSSMQSRSSSPDSAAGVECVVDQDEMRCDKLGALWDMERIHKKSLPFSTICVLDLLLPWAMMQQTHLHRDASPVGNC